VKKKKAPRREEQTTAGERHGGAHRRKVGSNYDPEEVGAMWGRGSEAEGHSQKVGTGGEREKVKYEAKLHGSKRNREITQDKEHSRGGGPETIRKGKQGGRQGNTAQKVCSAGGCGETEDEGVWNTKRVQA